MIQLSNPHITTRKTIALSRQTFVPKMMSLVFNTLSRFVIAFLHSITNRLSSLYSSSRCPNSKPSKLKLERKYSGIFMLFYHPKSFLFYWILSVSQFSSSVMSDCLQPHELQHARPPCPSPTSKVYPNSCPLNW